MSRSETGRDLATFSMDCRLEVLIDAISDRKPLFRSSTRLALGTPPWSQIRGERLSGSVEGSVKALPGRR